MISTYQQVNDVLRLVSLSGNTIIQEYGSGSILDWVEKKDNKYPMLFVDTEQNTHTYKNGLVEYNFKVYIFDIVSEDDSNRIYVISDMTQIGIDFVNTLRNNEEIYGFRVNKNIGDSISFDQLHEEFNNTKVGGVVFDIQILIPDDGSTCNSIFGTITVANSTKDGTIIRVPGAAGEDGTSGRDGQDGEDGTSGTSGSSGSSGADGADGSSGSSGSSGTDGADGSSGTSGSSGTDGADGSSGTSGADGAEGTSGSSGTDGAEGTSGSSGADGAEGTSGSSGADGAEGTSGSSGTDGADGAEGTSGSSGADGADGASGLEGTQDAIVIIDSSASSGYTTSSDFTYDGDILTLVDGKKTRIDGKIIQTYSNASTCLLGTNVTSIMGPPPPTTYGDYNTYLGTYAGATATGHDNVMIGFAAGLSTTTGNYNTHIGSYAGPAVVGSRNFFMGALSAYNKTSGDDNIFIGQGAGSNNTSGDDNIFIGSNTGEDNTGSGNIFINTDRSGSYKLGIGNLIEGDLLSDEVEINGTLYIRDIGYTGSTDYYLTEVGGVVYKTSGATGGGSAIEGEQYAIMFIDSGATDGYETLTGFTYDGTTVSITNGETEKTYFEVNGTDDTIFSVSDSVADTYILEVENVSGDSIFSIEDDVINLSTDVFTDRWLNSDFNTFLGVEVVGGDNLEWNAGLQGYHHTAIGYRAMYSVSTGRDNVAIGYRANYGGNPNYNTAIGAEAFATGGGSGSVAIGYNAGYTTSGSYNTFIGYKAGYRQTTGTDNIVMGKNAAYSVAGNAIYRNIIFGNSNGQAMLTGADNNIFIGHNVANTLTTGHDNIIIAYNTDSPAVDTSNYLNIGNLIYGDLTGKTLSVDGSVNIGGSITMSYVEKSANYTLTDSDYTVNCTTGTFTITLPTAVGITGRIYNVKNSGTGIITIDGDGTETIDGELTQDVIEKDSLQLQSTGSGWIII